MNSINHCNASSIFNYSDSIKIVYLIKKKYLLPKYYNLNAIDKEHADSMCNYANQLANDIFLEDRKS